MRKPNIAIVGATGLVGTTLLRVLEESGYALEKLFLYASKRSANTVLKYKSRDYIVLELNEENINDEIDIAIFTCGSSISKEYEKKFSDKGIYIIDNSSAFRNDLDVPLIVPGINDYLINKNTKIIANPNCSTIQAMLALNYLNQKYIIKRIIYNTYQAVSGSGYRGLDDLRDGLNGEQNKFYEKQIAFNLIPKIGEFGEDYNSEEELKMINETKRILNNDSLKVYASCIRVPVLNCHSININVECVKEINLEDFKINLLKDNYLKIYENNYPTPLDVDGSDKVHIGRIRKDLSCDNGISLWGVADNLRVGAATNALRIMDKLWKEIRDVI